MSSLGLSFLEQLFRVWENPSPSNLLIGAGVVAVTKLLLDSCYWIMHIFRYHAFYKISMYFRKVKLKQKYGEWAVISGCTSGIGRSFARELAHQNINIILISRDEEKLNDLSREIETLFHIKTIVLVFDFSEASLQHYTSLTEKLLHHDIGILVNNVGVHYNYPDALNNINSQKLLDIVKVNILPATLLTRIVLPGMIERNRGLIINMSSSAAFRPSPLIAAYSASKAYLDFLSTAVGEEMVLGSYGVSTLTLIPFYICTAMTRHSSLTNKSSLLVPTANTYVSQVLPMICHLPNGSHVRSTGYLPHTLQLWLSNYIPSFLWYRGSYLLHCLMRQQAKPNF